jgi:uncharacterized protein (DUF1778 family)
MKMRLIIFYIVQNIALTTGITSGCGAVAEWPSGACHGYVSAGSMWYFGTRIQIKCCLFGARMLSLIMSQKDITLVLWRIQTMSVSKQNQRVSARVPLHVYDMLSQAAELSGATVNQFLVQSALEKAQKVMERERFIRMTTRSASLFFDALENPPEPNEKLKHAIKAYKGSFYGAED